MKKFYRISWNVDSTPGHLFTSVVLALYVMLFLNTFVGSMGGIPAFAGFLVVYYLLRAMILSGNRISHNLAMNSKVKVKYLIFNYLAIYVVVWFLMKVVIFFSKFSGWGNIKKLDFSEYFVVLYGSTMLERWAYFFTGILMVSFVLSLFPLVTIKKTRDWFLYIVVDSAAYSIICIVISMISNMFINNKYGGHSICVLDNLLVCEIPQMWEAATFIAGMLIVIVLQLFFVYKFAVKVYGPQKGFLPDDESVFDINSKAAKIRMIKRNKTIITTSFIIVITAMFVVYFFAAPSDEPLEYDKVAECLTEDSILGPIVYENEIYVPIDIELNYDEKGKDLGYIAFKGEDCDSRFYKMAVSNVLYTDKKGEKTYVQMSGATENTYKKLSVVESIDSWKNDNVFLLWDEEWSSESAYSKEITGYTECEKELIESLEEEFDDVKINPHDFNDYDAYFTIVSYKQMKDAVESDNPKGTWVGCIFVKDNKFYYGNYENQITGLKLQKLLQVLGGNEK